MIFLRSLSSFVSIIPYPIYQRVKRKSFLTSTPECIVASDPGCTPWTGTSGHSGRF